MIVSHFRKGHDRPFTIPSQWNRMIFVNGCFDLLHDGHRFLLAEAKKLGAVVVAINTDQSVRTAKGVGRPVQRLVERIDALRGAGFKRLISFDTEAELRTICQRLRPNIMLKGSDYMGRKCTGSEFCGELRFVTRLPEFSTSDAIRLREPERGD